MKFFLTFVLSFLILAIPGQVVLAQTGNTSTNKSSATTTSQSAECDELQQKFDNAGAGALGQSLPRYCTEGSLFNKITTFLYSITAIIAVIAIIYGGYIYMTARGNDDARKKGREILTYSIIGLLVVVFAVTIVTVVSRYVVDNGIF